MSEMRRRVNNPNSAASSARVAVSTAGISAAAVSGSAVSGTGLPAALSGTTCCGCPFRRIEFLSFCIPLVGLILYLTWKDQKPISAKAMGKAALIGFIVSFVLSIAYYIIVFVIIGAASSYEYSSYYSIANFAAKLLG